MGLRECLRRISDDIELYKKKAKLKDLERTTDQLCEIDAFLPEDLAEYQSIKSIIPMLYEKSRMAEVETRPKVLRKSYRNMAILFLTLSLLAFGGWKACDKIQERSAQPRIKQYEIYVPEEKDKQFRMKENRLEYDSINC